MDTTTLCVQADHPSLAGHFPGQPIVPAVVILDAVFAEAQRCRPALIATRIRHAKFPRPLRPGATAEFLLEWRERTLLFTVTSNGEVHATGSLAFDGESPT